MWNTPPSWGFLFREPMSIKEVILRFFLYRSIPFCFLFSFFLLVKPLQPSETGVIQTQDVDILFDGQLRLAAEEAAKMYPAIKRELENVLGWDVRFRPTILLMKGGRAFQRMAGNDLIVAFAVPNRGLIVIDYSKMRIDPFTLDETIKHELCHLLLHKHIKGGDLPRWLDEGVAQWISGGLPDIIMKKNVFLDEEILSGRYLRIEALKDRFPKNSRALILAYAESKSLIDYIISKYGSQGIIRLLNHLKDGEPIDSAVIKSYSISLHELEKRWHDQLKKRATWIAFLINNLYEILFFIAGLLGIVGFIRVFIKKRSYRDKDVEPYL